MVCIFRVRLGAVDKALGTAVGEARDVQCVCYWPSAVPWGLLWVRFPGVVQRQMVEVETPSPGELPKTLEEAPNELFRVFLSAEAHEAMRWFRACVVGDGKDAWDDSDGKDAWAAGASWVSEKKNTEAIQAAPIGPKPMDVDAGPVQA